MKVKIENIKKVNKIKPFRVIFEINSEEDAIVFHDRIATKIFNKPHKFIGEIYERTHENEKEFTDKQYEI